jgi:hypothetical protein
MAVVMVRCQRTGRALHTGIETDPTTYGRLPDIVTYSRCPYCGVDHAWRKREAWLAESERLYQRWDSRIDHVAASSA